MLWEHGQTLVQADMAYLIRNAGDIATGGVMKMDGITHGVDIHQSRQREKSTMARSAFIKPCGAYKFFTGAGVSHADLDLISREKCTAEYRKPASGLKEEGKYDNEIL